MNRGRFGRFFIYAKRKIVGFGYRKAIVFVVCLALSAFLWLLNSLEKRYTGRIVVPVSYVDIPKDKKLAGNLPGKFDLIVDAYGYTLLSYRLRLVFSPVLLNVSELVDNAVEKGNRSRYTVFIVNHKEEIEKQISSEIRILSIKPDSLVFNFSRIVSKKIRIKPVLHLQFENQYAQQGDVVTSPDSILVSGPKNLMDTLTFVRTQVQSFNNLSRPTAGLLKLKPIEGLQFDETIVKINIPVEQITEVTFEIPVQIINKPADVALKTFPAKIKVSCRVGISKYKKLDINSFRASINFKDVSVMDTRLPVSFESLTNHVVSSDYVPKEVEYIVEH